MRTQDTVWQARSTGKRGGDSVELSTSCKCQMSARGADTDSITAIEAPHGSGRCQFPSKIEALDRMAESIKTAVLLVAGTGSRLRPLTDGIPKALVPINGRSILERAVASLRAHGVQQFVFATGYKDQAVRTAVGNMGIQATFCHNDRYQTTQNSISLLQCRAAIGDAGFYKLDGDLLFDARVLERLDAEVEPLAVAVDAVRALDAEAMKVTTNSSQRIRRFGKSIAIPDAYGESIGIERVGTSISDRIFDAIAALDGRGIVDRYYEDVYSELLADCRIAACAVNVGDLHWAEVDNMADLEHAEALFT